MSAETKRSEMKSSDSLNHCAIVDQVSSPRQAQNLGDAQVGLVHCIQSSYKEGWIAKI